jgi:S-adenosylmethionine:tRNA ribosyltransferase-isomerase
MRVADFEFELPDELIALRPAEPRESARLLVVGPDGGLTHAHVSDLPSLLRRGDTLVVNDTKVVAARLRGVRHRRDDGPGGEPKVELLLLRRTAVDTYTAFARPARKLAVGDLIHLGTTLEARVTRRGEGGEIEVVFAQGGAALDAAIAREGEIPLPPYIASKRPADARDASDYQTLFASRPGSVAAPTAGLHFTPGILDRLAASGIGRESITLHVGAGTFLPVSAEDTREHRMHSEWAELPEATAARLNRGRADGGRIVAVGTTSLRTLESAADEEGRLHAFRGETDIFITEGYRFRAVDVLLTNFHLPRSTLFMLVAAFSGLDVMKRAYAQAIERRYRFYSYGDACLLFRPA